MSLKHILSKASNKDHLKQGYKFLLISLILTMTVGCGKCEATLTPSNQLYKADYIEACQLIADKYIYLEDKLGITREHFIKEQKQHAEEVNWQGGKIAFVKELNLLKSRLPDGHLEWNLAKKEWPIKQNKFLGFTTSINQEGLIEVDRISQNDLKLLKKLKGGDVVVLWNGKSAMNELKKLESLIPQSTTCATREKAVRRLTLDYASQPLRTSYEPVQLRVKHADGTTADVKLTWQNCNLETEESNMKSGDVLVTKGKIASTESMPTDEQWVNPDLPYYARVIRDKNYVVVHPRSFYHWSSEDLDQTMANILEWHPDVVIIDLQDSAGGDFDHVLYLSHALNVKESMSFKLDYIDEDTNKRSQIDDNFNELAASIHLKNVWKGKVMIFTNSITVSAGDYFSKWMQLNHRGTLVGTPTAGAGGGTTDFVLKNTKTELSIPMRDRKLAGDLEGIEGHSIIPDIPWNGSLVSYLETIGHE